MQVSLQQVNFHAEGGGFLCRYDYRQDLGGVTSKEGDERLLAVGDGEVKTRTW